MTTKANTRKVGDRRVIHSKELHRRRLAGTWDDEQSRLLYLINDCVPEEGEHSQSHPDFVRWRQNLLMVQAAKSLMITCQRRGITVDHVQLSMGEQHCAWTGKDF